MPIRIGLAGDVMFGRLVDEHQRDRLPAAVWGSLLDHLEALDGFFVNLECCLSKRGRPWQRTKHAFHFRADPDWAVPALAAAGVDGVALANNHVLDFETDALLDTLDRLDGASIAHAGAGRDLNQAVEPAIVPVDDLTVGFLSFTDNTPEYAATSSTPGTAHVEMDVENEDTKATVRESLSRARDRDPDLVIASLHWGPNMVERPRLGFRDFAHWLIEEGVDVVFGHSAHVFQGVEVFRGRPILYDTGDFVDDYAVDDRLRNDRSFLFELRVSDDGSLVELQLRPTEIHGFAVHWAHEDAAMWSRERMATLSAEFDTEFDREGASLRVALGQ